MILIDTNVLSQPTRSGGSPAVIRWIDDRFDELLVPSVAVSELVYGAFRLGDEAQRVQLVRLHDAILLRFAGKFVSFDLDAARLHGQLTGEAARAGRMLPPSDAMIAAMALAHGLTVATRNTRHFAPTGVRLVDPWTAQTPTNTPAR